MFTQAGACDGMPHAWTANVIPANGKFAGGKSVAVTFAQSCGISACGEDYIERTVQLRGGK
jgi:hypothetical protein